MKTCCACRNCKPLDAFGRSKDMPDGLQKRCKECRNGEARRERQEHPDRVAARKAAEWKRNRDHYLQTRAEYRAGTRVQAARRDKAWAATEHGRHLRRAAQRRWLETHPEQRRAIARARIARCQSSYIRGLLTQDSSLYYRHVPEQLVDLKRAHVFALRALRKDDDENR